jgi:hypothetical protein
MERSTSRGDKKGNLMQDPEEEKQKQLMLIHKLATRLPWIVAIVFFISFLLIVLQLLF